MKTKQKKFFFSFVTLLQNWVIQLQNRAFTNWFFSDKVRWTKKEKNQRKKEAKKNWMIKVEKTAAVWNQFTVYIFQNFGFCTHIRCIQIKKRKLIGYVLRSIKRKVEGRKWKTEKNHLMRLENWKGTADDWSRLWSNTQFKAVY